MLRGLLEGYSSASSMLRGLHADSSMLRGLHVGSSMLRNQRVGSSAASMLRNQHVGYSSSASMLRGLHVGYSSSSPMLRGLRLGSSSSRLAAATSTNRNIHIGVVAAPFNKGQKRDGVKDGPKSILDTGVLKDLETLGSEVRDYGQVEMVPRESYQPGPNGEHNHAAVLDYNRRLAASVTKVIKEGGVCLTLGGDHSIGIGTVTGHAGASPRHQVVLLWVDAHADLNTGATSPSGNMHGMPVSYLLLELASRVNRLPDKWPQPRLRGEHLVYIGLRDVDEGEKKMLQELNIMAYGMREVDSLGLDKVICRSLEHLKPQATRPLHVSFDIDSLDPHEAPSTGTPVRGGLHLREGLQIAEAVHQTGYLRALDLVEVNPGLGSRDDAHLTSQAARLIILSALHSYRGQ
nr:arginase, hepatic-like [Procambarus clarkii]